jgi:hypothetical protein
LFISEDTKENGSKNLEPCNTCGNFVKDKLLGLVVPTIA